MSADVVSKVWAWRSFVWAGVVGSVVAWAWVWFRAGGASAVMVLFAMAAIVLAYKGTAGMRTALAGLMVVGFTMFLASLYWMYMLLLQGNATVNAVDVITTAVFPMVAAVVMLLGAAGGFRHTTSTSKATTSTTTS